MSLRRYGKKIFLEQLIQKRLADVAIDLFGMIAVLSRTTAVINEKGIENAQLEISVSQLLSTSETALLGEPQRYLSK